MTDLPSYREIEKSYHKDHIDEKELLISAEKELLTIIQKELLERGPNIFVTIPNSFIKIKYKLLKKLKKTLPYGYTITYLSPFGPADPEHMYHIRVYNMEKYWGKFLYHILGKLQL